MNDKYFIIIDGQQAGPYSKEELKSVGITPESHVWREGMPQWAKAMMLPELADVIYIEKTEVYPEPQQAPQYQAPQPQPQPQQPQFQPQQPQYQQPQQPQFQQPQQPQPQYQQPQQPQYQQPQYQQPQQPYQQQYVPGMNPYQSNIPHQNWMTWAIVATVIGFLFSCIGMIFGIIGIVKANNANKAYAIGDKNMGDMYNSGAKTWTIVAFVVSALGFLVSIFWLGNLLWWV